MKRVLGIRAAVRETKEQRDIWRIGAFDGVGGGGGVGGGDGFNVPRRVNKETRQVKEQYDKQLKAHEQAGNTSAFRSISREERLYFTECALIGGNPLHLQFKIQVHKSEIPDSYWPNCQFTFEALFEGEYPAKEPHVTCKTPIYHPNIADTTTATPGKVCISLLNSWKPSTTLFDIIEQIFITQFQDPNGNDPLPECQDIADLILSDKEEFRKRAKSHAERNKTFIPGSEEHRRWH